MRVTGETCVRNEGRLLLQWEAYTRPLGVTDVLICSNDCSDRGDANRSGRCTRIAWRATSEKLTKSIS